jgi:hypothetical protein
LAGRVPAAGALAARLLPALASLEAPLPPPRLCALRVRWVDPLPPLLAAERPLLLAAEPRRLVLGTAPGLLAAAARLLLLLLPPPLPVRFARAACACSARVAARVAGLLEAGAAAAAAAAAPAAGAALACGAPATAAAAPGGLGGGTSPSMSLAWCTASCQTCRSRMVQGT